jgi:hypothetical protein
MKEGRKEMLKEGRKCQASIVEKKGRILSLAAGFLRSVPFVSFLLSHFLLRKT